MKQISYIRTRMSEMRKIDPEKIANNLKKEYAKDERNRKKKTGKGTGLSSNSGTAPPPKKKGEVTKPTRIARESLALALKGCTDEIQSALKEIRYKNPKDYIECVVKLLPYVTPKLLAAQITEEKATSIEITLTKDTSLTQLKNLLGEGDESVEDIEFDDL